MKKPAVISAPKYSGFLRTQQKKMKLRAARRRRHMGNRQSSLSSRSDGDLRAENRDRLRDCALRSSLARDAEVETA